MKLLKTAMLVSMLAPVVVQAAGWQTLYNPDGTEWTAEQYSSIDSQGFNATVDGEQVAATALVAQNEEGALKVWFNIPFEQKKTAEVEVNGNKLKTLTGEFPYPLGVATWGEMYDYYSNEGIDTITFENTKGPAVGKFSGEISTRSTNLFGHEDYSMNVVMDQYNTAKTYLFPWQVSCASDSWVILRNRWDNFTGPNTGFYSIGIFPRGNEHAITYEFSGDSSDNVDITLVHIGGLNCREGGVNYSTRTNTQVVYSVSALSAPGNDTLVEWAIYR